MTTIDFTEAELRSFAPKMADFYLKPLMAGKAYLAAAGILNNGQRFTHFIAQCAAETGGFTIFRESLTYTSTKRIGEVWPARAKKETAANLKKLVRNPVALGDWAYGGRMGNRKGTIDEPHPDGYAYRGGGWIQTTGRSAVQKYCDLCKIENRPDILDDAEATLQFACAEWMDTGCNALADANDLMGISKAINTGSATSGIMPNGMEHRTAWFNKAKAIWWDAEMKATETAAPPTVAQNVQAAAQSSRTVFGVLIAGAASLFGWCKDLVLEAANQLSLLAPAKEIASGLGLKAATIAFVLTIAGLAIALFARLDDAAKGKNPR